MSQAAIIELDPSSKGAEKVIEEIVRLERRIFPKHESLARSFHDELRRKNGGLIYAKVESGTQGREEVKVKGEAEIVGYVMYSFVTSLCASITKLAVKDGYRRQGHGETLLKAAIERCRRRSIHRISLHVDPARAAAVSLYQKFGFQVETTIKGYYSSERDAYRMYLDFDQ
ncbi:Acyl-CoA N-acyltransferases (NAT) superfamily protein [Rhynchospora pubera]|uniref:Acyl-CoA N-acyltransferases (NAT) superfamily protein n=1 Tax=Rhynchospora pubera TaxID=906938 RepID=A0AAV8F0W9_9POAL|nr:Acyl-CoA N-acyltransferases (NAT) superfamily protein [Rhynchospora pubera]